MKIAGLKLKVKNLLRKIKHSYIFIGFISLLWLVFRSGRKPQRLEYPCQKIAVSNVAVFLGASSLAYPFGITKLAGYKLNLKKLTIVFVLFICVLLAGNAAWQAYQTSQESKYSKLTKYSGPAGKVIGQGALTGSLVYATIPHASALSSPHRVVSSRDTDATTWNFPCVGWGVCASYYGSDSYINQNVVDQMFSRGLMALTDSSSEADAWRVLLPDYQAGEKIAVKVNFNCANWGGGVDGYGDNDAYIDAIPQIVNSMAKGLKEIGVNEQDIWIYDATRWITDRFRNEINYPGISYFDSQPTHASIQKADFVSTNPSANIDFTGSGFAGSGKVTDVLVNADYLINIPIIKGHDISGISLTLKNHIGSVRFSADWHPQIDVRGSASYSSDKNPLTDIFKNTNIKDKTVLNIGDALYGGWNSNNTAPSRWISFGNDSPQMLLFSVDPIAIDSVMYDYIAKERRSQNNALNARVDDVLDVSAKAGLGVFEHWDNDADMQYTAIDYVNLDLDALPCGDGECGTGETCLSCPADCACPDTVPPAAPTGLIIE